MLISPQKENNHLNSETCLISSKVHMCALNRVTQWPYAKPVLYSKYVLNKAWVWYILSVHFRSNPLKIFPISSPVLLVLNLCACSKVHDGVNTNNVPWGLCMTSTLWTWYWDVFPISRSPHHSWWGLVLAEIHPAQWATLLRCVIIVLVPSWSK